MAIYSDAAFSKPAPPKKPLTARSSRGRAIIFTLVALVAGGSSAWLVTRYVSRHTTGDAQIVLKKVVVASVDIPVGTLLNAGMLKTVDWPSTTEPQGAFDGLPALEGRVASTALVAGEPIVERRLSAKGSGVGIASLIPANMRAMTVSVNDVVGVSGFIHPGDVVDVITTMQEPPAAGATGMPGYRSKIVLQNIRVLAVGKQLATASEKAESFPSVTLLVSPPDAERLALASTQGKLQLTMRSQNDAEQTETTGVSPPELLGAARPVPAATPPAPPVRAFVAVAAAPARRGVAAVPNAASPAPATVEVVEVFHGDRVENKKINPKAATP
jgi:pilus assembly protein CpaB